MNPFAGTRNVIALLVVLVTGFVPGPAAPAVFAQAGTPSTAASVQWHRLTHQTGWLFLGLLQGSKNEWAQTQPSFIVLGVGKDDEPARVLPQAGDRIKLLTSEPLVILGYKKTRELNAHKAPAEDVPINKTEDVTDIDVPAGAVVKVEEVRINQAGALRVLWVRVSPAEKPASPAR